jgi:predicted transcriptional regulator
MAILSYRATFSLDAETIKRLKRFARDWNVSQAEVVRRALAQMEEKVEKSDPIEMLRQLHESGHGLGMKSADKYLSQVYRDRKQWRN